MGYLIGDGGRNSSIRSLQGSDSCWKLQTSDCHLRDSLGPKEVLTRWGWGKHRLYFLSVGLRGTIGGRMQGGTGGLPWWWCLCFHMTMEIVGMMSSLWHPAA